MHKERKYGALIISLICFFSNVLVYQDARGQQGYRLLPISGADGVFETVILDADTIYRPIKTNGGYAPYMYFAATQNVPAQTLYLEVTYKDTGFGSIGVQYNSARSDYRRVSTRYQNYVRNSGQKRTAVYELKDANFRKAQNLMADLRLNTDGSLQMHIISASIFLEPSPLFLKNHEDWISPYSGPVYTGPDLVRADSITGKVVCGYQGWFRAAGDPADVGWKAYIGEDFSDLTVDMWPDMLEYSWDEKYPVPGWTHANGDQAYLFSSANKRTVTRHFQWMRAYGIDCAAIQRFVPTSGVPSPLEPYRIPAYAREAANRTGRTYYIMYDVSGCDPDTMVDVLRKDWQFFVDSMKITQDSRYLRHDGKPVVGIFGFFVANFSDTLVPNQVLDLFQNAGPYQAFVAGSGAWWWRSETAPGWQAIFRRMDAYIPWNVGNYAGDYTRTDYWLEDKNDLESSGVLYMPLVYPGFGWDNLMNEPPGTSKKSRLNGEFIWRQFLKAKSIGAKAVYVAMFDEINEGTAIFKVANDIPVNHYFQTLEGLPSDFYLLLTGFGRRLIRNEVSTPVSMPDFAAWSQPPVPEILSPSNGDTADIVSISWTPVQHTSGIAVYELEVDNQTIITTTTHYTSTLGEGQHTVHVQATNGLGNKSGFSEPIIFFIVAAPAAPTLASPSNGATGVSTSPTLSWNSSTGATSYRVQVSTNSSFTSLVYDQSGITGTSQQVSGLANNTLYYWRVNGTNAGGTSDWSSARNFRTALRGDFNADDVVDVSDLVLFAGHFGLSSGDPGYEAPYDLNSDNTVDVSDLVIFASAFGTSGPSALMAGGFEKAQTRSAGSLKLETERLGGDRLQVTVVGDDLREVKGFQFRLRYDKERAVLEEVKVGNMISGRGLFIDRKADSDILIGGAAFPEEVLEGGGSLAVFVFRGKEVEGVEFAVHDGILLDTDNRYHRLGVHGEGIPSEYRLYENYPNPFNPTTVIAFDLPKDGQVTLKLYNLLGEEVMTLTNGHYQAGSHKVEANLSSLGSGVYFYRLSASTSVSAKKMLLIR